MDVEALRDYALAKENAEESFPFGNDTLVVKVGGKIFLLISLDASPLRFNAKCDPDHAEELREQYSSIIPGYHMNKKHWNTVIVDGSLSNKLLKEMIDESYTLVAPQPKKQSKK